MMSDILLHHSRLFTVRLLFSLLFWLSALVLLLEEHKTLADLATQHNLDWLWIAAALLVAVLFMVLANGIGRIKRLARLSGHAVALGGKQYPDLEQRVKAVCKRLGVDADAGAYLYHGSVDPAQLSTRSGGHLQIVLPAHAVGVLTDRQGAIDALIGRQVARITMPYRKWRWFLAPSSVIPLLGNAWQRAEIYRLDAMAIKACQTGVDAALALATEVAGDVRWKSLNVPEFSGQSAEAAAFTLSLAELLSETPWTSKRMAHLRAIATRSDAFIPRQHPLAVFLAALVPSIQLGRLRSVLQIFWVLAWIALATLWWPRIASFTGDLFAQWWPTQSTAIVATAAKGNSASPYDLLLRDIKLLGKEIARIQKKEGGNPCELENVGQLRLNFPASRYAFSCDRPTIYTSIEQGEFEPAKQGYMLQYDWKTGKFSESKKDIDAP